MAGYGIYPTKELMKHGDFESFSKRGALIYTNEFYVKAVAQVFEKHEHKYNLKQLPNGYWLLWW